MDATTDVKTNFTKVFYNRIKDKAITFDDVPPNLKEAVQSLLIDDQETE